MTSTFFCKSDELAPEAVLCKRLDGVGQIVAARLPESGEIVAFAPLCPHAGGPLAQGKLRGSAIVCPWHFFPFDLRTGKIPNGESGLQLRRYPVTVAGDEIFIEVGNSE